MEVAIASCLNKNKERITHEGIHIDDNDIDFDYHFNQLYKKPSEKLHALTRYCIYIDGRKQRTLIKAFITSQFSYCPLV